MMKKAKLTQQVLMALLMGSSMLPGSMAQAAELTVTTDQSGNISLPGSGNTLTIESGTIDGYAYGGFLDTGDVTGNTVTMKDGTVNKWIYGGYAPTGNATGNTVTMNGGTVNGWIGGGGVEDGNATGNTVTMNGGTVNDLDGGSVNDKGDATGNTVTMNAGTVKQSLHGGYASVGNATGNTVTMNGGTVDNWLSGGYAGIGDATGNTVTMNDGTAKTFLYGGFSSEGNVTGNTVTLNGGTIEVDIAGGNTWAGNAIGNTVTMNGGTVKLDIYGGHTKIGNATGNTVTLNDGTVYYIYGGAAVTGNATGNTVTMNGGTVEVGIYGGSTTTGNAVGNTVTVNAGTVVQDIYGGNATTGNAVGNTVTIHGGTLDGIYGGYVDGTGDASGNTVTITGGTVTGDIRGGWTENGSASDNIVNLYGGDLTQAKIYGGYTSSGSSTGNTLNVYTPLTVKEIHDFQNYNFYIPASLTGTAALLTVSHVADMADLNDTTVSSIVIAGSSAYKTGDTITLISAGNLASITGSSLSTPSVTAQKGLSTYYTALLNMNVGISENGDGTLTATLGEATLNPKVKALSETQVAALASLNTGSDLVAGSGLENALVAAGSGNGQAVGFAGTSVGRQTISTGSEVDGRGGGLMAGAAATRRIAAGRLTTGVFGEVGWGSFTTTNDISGASVNADGHSSYKGGGILARLDRPDGIYYEGSLHAGHMDSTYASSDVTDYQGKGTSYDVGSPYYSAHMGLGRVWQLGAKEQLDVYGKYLWSHVPSRSVTVAGDAFDFAAVSSNRLRLGTRWTKRCDDGSAYAGLAAEREFSGNQHATAAGMDIPAPSLSGMTGIVELGWYLPQSADQPVAVNFGLSGLFGKRHGIAGGMSFSWGW